ncbi:unnamed protein product [Rotaria sp. Silwood1]|nr:unnamed protein product [Rotaria sp. Silwood1]
MKTVKIVVDVSMYPSIEVLKEPRVSDQISKQVYNILEKNRQKARDSAIIKACKNAVSLLLSKKKGVSPTFLSVYLPLNIIESSDDTVVPSVSSDEDLLETSVGEDDDSIHSDQLSSSNSQGSHISFSLCNNVMTANTTFEYLFDYFKHSLSINNKPMNLEKIVKDVCSYAFLELNCSVNIRMLKKEISRQISHIVQSARERAAGKSVIEILRTKNVFSLIFKSIDSLNRLEPSMGFIRYKNDDYLSPSLFIRENNDETAIFQFYPFSNIVEITINETLVRKALSSFDLVRALDTSEIFNLVSQCVATYDLKLNLPVFEEILKTKILFERSTLNSSYFLTMSVNVAEKEDQIDKVNEQSHIDDSHSFCEEEIDAIIGRTYNTRGVKRSSPFLSERLIFETDYPYLPPQNLHGKYDPPTALIATAIYLSKAVTDSDENLNRLMSFQIFLNMSINVNAERCRAYHQRISNVSNRLQNTDTTLSQQGNDISVHQKENIMLMNKDEMIQNDINNYFYQMHDLNDDEIELNSFIYNNNSCEVSLWRCI